MTPPQSSTPLTPLTDKLFNSQADRVLGAADSWAEMLVLARGLERKLEALERANAGLREENFALAAGQCIVDKGGLTGDEGGTPYCAMKLRAERVEQQLAEAQKELGYKHAREKEITEFYERWPVGLDEVEASIAGHKRIIAALREQLAERSLDVALNVRHPKCHEAADAFWTYWRENGETHKHGYYESTWGAINRTLRLIGVVPHKWETPERAAGAGKGEE